MASPRISAAALVIAVLPLAAQAQSSVQPANTLRKPHGECVADDAGVLSKPVMQHIDAVCSEVEQRMHIQMAVVAMKSTGDVPLDEYARQVRTDWALGARDSGRGLLILAPLSDRLWSITGTPAVATMLPQTALQPIGRRMDRFLRVSQNDEGMTSATEQVADLLAKESGVMLQVPRSTLPFPHYKPIKRRQKALVLLMLLICGVLLWRALPLPWKRG